MKKEMFKVISIDFLGNKENHGLFEIYSDAIDKCELLELDGYGDEEIFIDVVEVIK